MSKAKDLLLPVAIVVTALYIGGGGAAKLAGIPYVHSSFPKLGLPPWFGYFIGTCEVLGSIALFIRPLSALAALGLLVIMIGATYYHATYTPIVQAAPAFVLALLCVYIFSKRRGQLFRFNVA
jgi:putative oxidoreductase